MDSSLLAVLRYLGRNYPPYYDQPALHGTLLLWAVFKDYVAVFCTPTNFILDYDAHAILMASDSHKTREVRNFIANLLDQACFATISYRKRIPLFSFLVAQLFFKRRFRKVLGHYSWIRRRYPARIGRDFLRFFLYQAVAEHHFSSRPPAVLAIVSDLGPRRIGFAKAARKSGTAVIYYQYGQHHSFRPPFHVDYGICINNSLADKLKQKFGSTIVNRTAFEGAPEELKFRAVPENPVVGIVTSVYPDSEGINRMLVQLKSSFSPSHVLYKPHPRNTEGDLRDITCDIFDKDVDIDVFASRIDLCICGDTTAILKVLLAGTPCLHLPDIDRRSTDKYGYVRESAILGTTEILDVGIEDINRFYLEPKSLSNIRNFVEKNVVIDPSKDESGNFTDSMRYISQST